MGQTPGVGSNTREGGGAAQPCVHNCIQSVWVLNPYPEQGREVQQFVNLPQDEAFQGHTDEHGDRRGRRIRVRIILRLGVEEAGQGPFSFHVRMVPGGSNAFYTNQEKNRSHGHYRAQPDNQDWIGPLTISSGNSMVIEDRFSVAAAGGDTYTIQAKCAAQEHIVSSRPIRVWRRIWVQEVKMRGVAAAASLDEFRNKYQNEHHLAIRQHQAVTMPHMPNIGDGYLEKQQFLRNTRSAYDSVRSSFSSRERYVVVVAYMDQLAAKEANMAVRKSPVMAPGFNTSETMEHFIDVPITDGATERYLWKGIETASTDEERFQSWFVSAHFIAGSQRISIPNPRQNVRPVPDPDFVPERPDACRMVRVNVARLVPRDTNGRIELVVNAVNRFRGGISYGGSNLICLCTRAYWHEKSQSGQNTVLIHELGHTIGMVPDGNPGQTCDLEHSNALFPNQYRGRGHRGSHCCAGVGAPAGTTYDGSENPTCVMFGSSRSNVRDFCQHCARAVNKVDLSQGWDLFSPTGWTLLQFF